MLVICKESKMDKLDENIFSICAVSEKDIEGATELAILLPPKDLLDKLESKDIKKSKFEDKYKKYLSKSDTMVEWTIYSIGVSLSTGKSVALVCTDDEWDLGYLQILGEYLEDVYELSLTSIKDVKEELETAFEDADIKKKKLKAYKKGELDDEAAEKVARKIQKSLSDEFESNEFYETLQKKYAVDSVVLSLASGDDPVITFDKKNAIKSIDPSKYDGKKSTLIDAIMAPRDVYSETKADKVIKRVLEAHDLKYKEKDLSKQSKGDLISLMCEMYSKLGEFRLGALED